MKTVVISQPQYLPWAGYFRVMKEADVYVFLDNVQFEQASWQCRNRIKTVTKWTWLTIPTHHTGQSKICEIDIDNSKPWQRQHWTAIKTSYGRAQYFHEHSSFFKSIYEMNWSKLTSLTENIIKYFSRQLAQSPVFVQASKLGVEGKRTELLLEICKMFDATRYVSSVGAKEYMEKDGAKKSFKDAGIELEFLEFNLPNYKQLFDDFIPGLSFIDLLFNCGPDCSKILLDEGCSTFSSL
jgi:hypothetical protein